MCSQFTFKNGSPITLIYRAEQTGYILLTVSTPSLSFQVSVFHYLPKSLHVQRLSNVCANAFFFSSQRIDETLKKSLSVGRETVSLMQLGTSNCSK